MDDQSATHRILFEDGRVMDFRSVSFEPDSIVADGKVIPYSIVDEVHILE